MWSEFREGVYNVRAYVCATMSEFVCMYGPSLWVCVGSEFVCVCMVRVCVCVYSPGMYI